MNTNAVYLKIMSPRKKRSKDYYPSQWSEWEWNEQYQCDCRYREKGERDWKWEYSQAAQEQCQTIGTHTSDEAPETWQLYNQLENEEGKRTDLEGDSSTYEMEMLGENQNVAPQNQQHSTQGDMKDIYAIRDNLDLRYSVHSSSFWKIGRVFMVLWREPVGAGGTKITVSPMKSSTTAFHRVRRFVIIKSCDRQSICIPILTCGGHAFHKPAVKADDHGMIYSPSNKGSKTEKHGGTFERAIKLEPMHHSRSQIDIASRTNYAKVYTVEHYVKVFFIGQVDQRDMERLQSGDTGWMRSDTGEDIPIIMEDQSCPSFDCQGNKFQFPCRYAVPSRMIPSVALPSGLLMSSSFLWLNQRMELYEPSATLGNIINRAKLAIPKSIPEAMLGIPNGILFAFFLVGTAGLTGATIATVRHRDTSAKLFAFQLVLALAGLIASGMVGFSLEEIVLVCLPTIISCSILSSSVVGRKQAGHVHQEKVILSGV